MMQMEAVPTSSTANNGNVLRDDDYRKRILQSAYEIRKKQKELSNTKHITNDDYD